MGISVGAQSARIKRLPGRAVNGGAADCTQGQTVGMLLMVGISQLERYPSIDLEHEKAWYKAFVLKRHLRRVELPQIYQKIRLPLKEEGSIINKYIYEIFSTFGR